MQQNQTDYSTEIVQKANELRLELENIYKKGIQIFKHNHTLQSVVVNKSSNSEPYDITDTGYSNQEQKEQIVKTQETDLLFQTSITFSKDEVSHIYTTYKILYDEFTQKEKEVNQLKQVNEDLRTFIKLCVIEGNVKQSQNKLPINKEIVDQIWNELKLEGEKHVIQFVVDLMKESQNNYFEPQPLNQQIENIKASLGKLVTSDLEKRQMNIKDELKTIQRHLFGIKNKLEVIKNSNSPAESKSVVKLRVFLNSQCGLDLQAFDTQIYNETRLITKQFMQLKIDFDEFQNQKK